MLHPKSVGTQLLVPRFACNGVEQWGARRPDGGGGKALADRDSMAAYIDALVMIVE